MKRFAILILMIGASIIGDVAYAAKMYSQRTYTLFADGHYERKTCYTDGSCDPLEQGFFKKPVKGDWKHIEEVWRNGRWEKTVTQQY